MLLLRPVLLVLETRRASHKATGREALIALPARAGRFPPPKLLGGPRADFRSSFLVRDGFRDRKSLFKALDNAIRRQPDPALPHNFRNLYPGFETNKTFEGGRPITKIQQCNPPNPTVYGSYSISSASFRISSRTFLAFLKKKH